MKKYFSIIAVCTVLALAACNSAEHKEEGGNKDSLATESTPPTTAPVDTTASAPADSTATTAPAAGEGH